MELKNASPNSCNVIVHNLNPKILFFSAISKSELHKRPQRSFQSSESIFADNIEFFITFVFLIRIE